MDLTTIQSSLRSIFESLRQALILSLCLGLSSCSMLNNTDFSKLGLEVGEIFALDYCQKNRSINEKEFENCQTETKETYVDLERQRQEKKDGLFINKNYEYRQ